MSIPIEMPSLMKTGRSVNNNLMFNHANFYIVSLHDAGFYIIWLYRESCDGINDSLINALFQPYVQSQVILLQEIIDA